MAVKKRNWPSYVVWRHYGDEEGYWKLNADELLKKDPHYLAIGMQRMVPGGNVSWAERAGINTKELCLDDVVELAGEWEPIKKKRTRRRSPEKPKPVRKKYRWESYDLIGTVRRMGGGDAGEIFVRLSKERRISDDATIGAVVRDIEQAYKVGKLDMEEGTTPIYFAK